MMVGRIVIGSGVTMVKNWRERDGDKERYVPPHERQK